MKRSSCARQECWSGHVLTTSAHGMKPLAKGSREASNQALLGTGDDLDDGRPDDNEEEDRQHHRADCERCLVLLVGATVCLAICVHTLLLVLGRLEGSLAGLWHLGEESPLGGRGCGSY
ncbi:unnamed protein product [Polarella glacialis]|uniref:Uncharacterized protein n=1 Tax=Polarella glacialis TaxID=89957 RepID=A0A813E2C8_POLGL|nr:unnamed protein product [Polarella glacialis]